LRPVKQEIGARKCLVGECVRTQDIEAVLGIGAQRRWSAGRVAKWLAIVVVVAAVISGAAYWLLGGTQPAIGYVSEPVTIGTLTVTVTATGSVQPTNKVDISTELSGTVREVLVDYNSPVTPGQVLAELDTDRLEATVASSRARVAAAEARVAETAATIEEKQGDYERKQLLAERQVTSCRTLPWPRRPTTARSRRTPMRWPRSMSPKPTSS
jgi:HlyD family secretion protein